MFLHILYYNCTSMACECLKRRGMVSILRLQVQCSLVPRPHPPKGKGLVTFATFLGTHFESVESSKLITFWYENSIRFAEACMCVGTVKFLSNFTYSSKEATSHRAWSVLYYASIKCKILLLILHRVPRNVVKATRPSPLGVWSGHETTCR